ncbi:WGR domain-containing protein [Dysgonomonas sp. 521]|uniref:WGR domain-containing protein n=1 Tax=Dysgonomonas sp. 521 TaxID=2302932 RepID=UPI0013D32C15|nr:WGR domain-containing protein [Dysgonomonas sp. 521]NDV94332.1 WGR domain-containing protein [Dysgonomonas sp. 521]
MKRTFLYKDEKSNKFWSIEISGNSFDVNFGKTGTNGQMQTKEFPDETTCLKEANKLIAEKIKKGYIEEGSMPVSTAESLKTHEIVVDLSSVDDIRRVLETLLCDINQTGKIVSQNKGLIYGRISDGKFEAYGNAIESEELFFENAVMHRELIPLVEKYIKTVDPNQFFNDEVHMGMAAAYKLALSNDNYVPLFTEYHRKIRPGGGMAQLDQVLSVISATDNGLRLLAACCVYAIDCPDLEYNLEESIAEHLADNDDQKEILFRYILEEVSKMKDKEFATDYVTEALEVMGVEYDPDIVEETIEKLSPRTRKYPTLEDLIEE